MYVNPFWFGFALGIIAGVVSMISWAVIYTKERRKKDGDSKNNKH